MPADCTDRPYDADCMKLTDYDTSGFPIQFDKSKWHYLGGVENFTEGSIATTTQSFSWPGFILNSLIWSAPAWAVLWATDNVLAKRTRKK